MIASLPATKRRFAIEPLEERVVPGFGFMFPHFGGFQFQSQSQFQFQAQTQAQAQVQAFSFSFSFSSTNGTPTFTAVA